MRVCFYNPQALVNNGLGTSLFATIVERGKAAARNRRFDFLLEVLRDEKYEAAIVVDGTVTSLPLHRLGPIFNNYYFIRFFSFFEIYAWCLLNRISPFRRTILFSLKRLDPKRDVLFGFAFLGTTFFDDALTERSFFKKFEGRKILHATHFYERTKLVADNIRKTNTKEMIAEANLKNSDYFNKYFGFIDAVRIVPYVLRDRYVSTTPFAARKNKCVALGSLVLFPDGHKPTEDHFAYFQRNTLHPMRKAIAEHHEKIADVLDSLIITRFKEPLTKRKGWYAALRSAFVSPAGQQYHSFNIIDTYNNYKMFVAPEEDIGLPSVNAIEGMSCGCAYVGLDSQMYADVGMKEGVHYVGYDGTIEGLAQKIKYYAQHQAELEMIAAAGRSFVLAHFKEEMVIKDFLAACSY